MDDPTFEEQPVRHRRPRFRHATASGARGLPRPLLIALIVVIAAGAAIFWPRGGGVATQGRPRLAIVAADTSRPAAMESSSEVDLATARPPLVAERTRTEPAPPPVQPGGVPGRTAERQAPPRPTPSGDFALQVGSFAEQLDADLVRNDLAARDHPVHVRAVGTADGKIVYRVTVGYFADRGQAEAYRRAFPDAFADALVVHR